MRMLVLWMWTYFSSHREQDRNLVRHLLPALLHEYQEQAGSTAGDVLTRVQSYVQANLRKRLRLADLAGAAEMSPFHFAHIFKRRVGVTPMQYLRQARVEAAREQLLHSDLSLKTIARLTGFANPYHLSRVFKNVTGVPPSSLRTSGSSPGKR
jgi:transcriptional regulator GlxA family with amidase domain